MEIEEDSIWYNPEDGRYVMVSDILVDFPVVDSNDSSVGASMEDVTVYAGGFERHGWAAVPFGVEDFCEQHEKTNMTLEEALAATEENGQGEQ